MFNGPDKSFNVDRLPAFPIATEMFNIHSIDEFKHSQRVGVQFFPLHSELHGPGPPKVNGSGVWTLIIVVSA